MNRRFALPLTAALGGAAAFALRLLQNSTGFETDTGLPIPGNSAALALVVLLVLLGGLLALLSRPLSQEELPVFPDHFRTASPGLLTLPMMGIFLMGLSGLADLSEGFGLLPEGIVFSHHALYGILREGGLGFSAGGQTLMGLLSLVSAAGLFVAAVACRREDCEVPPTLGPALLAPVAALVIRLVLTYRVDSVNPSLALYYVELLALVFLTLGFYRLSSFAFQAGQTSRFALYTGAATVLCIAALADGSAYLSSLLLYAGGALTLMGFLLLRLLGPVPQPQPEEEDAEF